MKQYITYQIHYYILVYLLQYSKLVYNNTSGYYDSNITIPQPKWGA